MAGRPLRLVKKALLVIALTTVACSEHSVHQSAAPDVVHDISELETITNRFVDNGWAKGVVIALVQGARGARPMHGALRTRAGFLPHDLARAWRPVRPVYRGIETQHLSIFGNDLSLRR